jgi:molecular chaperone HtpG
MVTRIDTDYKLDDLSLIKHLKNLDSPFLPKMHEVYEDVKDVLNTRVQHVFPNYTLHNTGHSFRIMEYMTKIVADLSRLSELEVALLFYSALLHDIGMAVSHEDIEAIKSDSFEFCDVKFSAMKKLMLNDENLALQEYVRRIHASLSGKFVRTNLKDKLVIPKLTTLDFSNELAVICESHTQDYDWIKRTLRINDVRGDYHFNSQFIASVLRLGDILDIDGNRTPYNLYKLISPKGISDEEWKQHYVISNNDKIALNETTQQKRIVFHGKATNASIHRKILIYIGWVQTELINATALVNGMAPKYNLIYDTTPEVNIQTEGYTFSDYKMTLEFKAISSLLMGEKIYGSKSLGLRELIQNSMDSCRIRQETIKSKLQFGEDPYLPKIKVILDSEKKQVIIKDNGTGMSMEIIKKHFLNIGVSYYNSTDFLLKDFDYKPIGNFGIGFLSCFMLSDTVKVITRHYLSSKKYLIELEQGNEWTSLTETEDLNFDGTEVILELDHFMSVFDNKIQKVKDFLKLYFLTDGVDFELIDKSKREITKIENPSSPNHSLEKGLLKIEFQNHLRDIQGYALIKKKNNFVKKFVDLNFTGELYTYIDGDGLKQVTDHSKLNIDDYVFDQQIKYLSIPIVESHIEDDYLNGMKFTDDDVSEVIRKMDRDLKWLSIITPKDSPHLIYGEKKRSGDWIIGDLTFEDLEDLGHCTSCEIETSIEIINLFEGRKNELYLPFDKKDFDSYFSFRNDKRKELFMRNVLIKDFRFDIPVSTSVFEIQTIVANINSKHFIPDISRNNVDAAAQQTINYIIGKAIHSGAVEILELSIDEKNTIKRFITTFYEKKTEFEK